MGMRIYISDVNEYRNNIFKKVNNFENNKRRKTTADKDTDMAVVDMLNEGLANFGLCECDMEYAYYKKGKPYFKNREDICFNISHTKNFAAVVFSDTDVGIDIEEKGRMVDMDRFTKRFFSVSENEYFLEAEDKEACFFKLWTRKESLLKADGCGITTTLSGVDVTSDTVSFNGTLYRFFDLSHNKLYGTVCKRIK